MKIVVFGASGGTGKQVVRRALKAGHQVRAFVRNAEKLDLTHENLSVITGDALDEAAVERAVHGMDAVLSALGPKGKPLAIVANSTGKIVDAMKKEGVKRLVVVSVGGILQSKDQPGGFNKFLSGLIKRLQRELFEDREKQLQILQDSGLEWVAARVPRLLDAPPTGKVHAGYWGSGNGMSLTRADLASFMLEQLEGHTWLGQAPVVTNGK
jgi:putative NADH-flavin reductase